MQEGISKNWRNLQNQKGIFREFTVMGHMYESPGGETGWHITAYETERGHVHTYWVSGRDFFAAHMYIGYGMKIEITDIINDKVEEKERAAVLKAVTEWEKPDDSSGNRPNPQVDEA